MKLTLGYVAVWLLGLVAAHADAHEPAALTADRLAVEKVYYDHRLGTKLLFAQAMPAELALTLVKTDLKKEAVLSRVYGIVLTDALVQAEVERINTTTRAPEVLLELKQALGNDPARFARTVARPLVVDRLLRQYFDNDDQLHAEKRRLVVQLREQLLEAKKAGASAEKLAALLAKSHIGTFHDITWQLGSPVPGDPSPAPGFSGAFSQPSPPKASSGSYTVQSAAPLAQVPAGSKRDAREFRFHFADLPLELQRVLRAQLRGPGDISAVIEMPSEFVLFVLKRPSGDEMSVASVSLAKCSFDEWLAIESDTTREHEHPPP